MKEKQTITIALPKGRMLKEAVLLFKKAGMDAGGLLSGERKLMLEDKKERIRFMIVRAQDVPTYVEYGAADAGVAGKDILVEQEKDLY